MRDAIHWDISVSPETDQTTRLLLANQKGRKKLDLSHFVEEAVRDKIFEFTVGAAKEKNLNISEEDLNKIIKEAVDWARRK